MGIGKWHLGMRSPESTPVGRGFQESYGFLGGSENHFTSTTGPHCAVFGQPVDYYAQGGSYSAKGENIASCDVAVADRVPCPLFSVMSKNGSGAEAEKRCRAGSFANCAFDDRRSDSEA